MKTIVIFTAANNELNSIPVLKQKVLNYMGERSIEDDCSGTPHIIFKESLTKEDKIALSQMVEKYSSQSICMLLIETANTPEFNFIWELKPTGDELVMEELIKI